MIPPGFIGRKFERFGCRVMKLFCELDFRFCVKYERDRVWPRNARIVVPFQKYVIGYYDTLCKKRFFLSVAFFLLSLFI